MSSKYFVILVSKPFTSFFNCDQEHGQKYLVKLFPTPLTHDNRNLACTQQAIVSSEKFFKHQVAMREETEPCSNYFQFQNRSFHSFTTSTTTTACGRVDFNLFFVKSQFAHSPLNKFLSASDDSARRWIDTPALEVACLVGQKNKNHSTFQNRSCM